mgnify:FL=1
MYKGALNNKFSASSSPEVKVKDQGHVDLNADVFQEAGIDER